MNLKLLKYYKLVKNQTKMMLKMKDLSDMLAMHRKKVTYYLFRLQ